MPNGLGSEEQTERIRELERYVQRLGGDPKQLNGTTVTSDGVAMLRQHGGQVGLEQSNVAESTMSVSQPKSGDEDGSKRANVMGPSSLITHGDEESYIETYVTLYPALLEVSTDFTM